MRQPDWRAFNRNVLARLKRELGARLDLDAFEHRAFYDEGKARIEMHLRARRSTEVIVDRLEVRLSLRAGESIRTEISRKFTVEGLEALLAAAGLGTIRTFVAPVPYALALARSSRR